MTDIKKDKSPNQSHEPKPNPSDSRKQPRPGYNEKNPAKKDIQDHPENQNTG